MMIIIMIVIVSTEANLATTTWAGCCGSCGLFPSSSRPLNDDNNDDNDNIITQSKGVEQKGVFANPPRKHP